MVEDLDEHVDFKLNPLKFPFLLLFLGWIQICNCVCVHVL